MSADEALLGEVRAAFTELDPVPEGVLARGRAALGWRTPGAVLTELTAERHASAAGLRAAEARLLTFTGPDVAVEVEVTGTGAERELSGRLTPATAARVQVRHPGGRLFVSAGRSGLFTASEVPSGLVSLVFLLPDATSVVTSWVHL